MPLSQASEGHLQDCLNRVNEELNNHAPYQKKRAGRYVGKINPSPCKSVEFKQSMHPALERRARDSKHSRHLKSQCVVSFM